MGTSLISTVFVLLVFGGCGAYYYFVVYKKMMSPEARAKAFAAAGYRPGEAVQASFGGLLLRRDANGGFMEAVMDLQRGGTATHVFSNITTHDRLHVTIGIGSAAQNVLFEANARPSIRVLGRVFLQDKTGIGDMLMDVTKTALYWVAEGNPQPPGHNRSKDTRADHRLAVRSLLRRGACASLVPSRPHGSRAFRPRSVREPSPSAKRAPHPSRHDDRGSSGGSGGWGSCSWLGLFSR